MQVVNLLRCKNNLSVFTNDNIVDICYQFSEVISSILQSLFESINVIRLQQIFRSTPSGTLYHAVYDGTIHLPRNGAPFNIPLVVEFKWKSTSAAGEINDTAVVDIAQDIFTKPHTTNNTF